MNIAVTGGKGQLGECIRKIFSESHTNNKYYFYGHEADITNKDEIFKFLDSVNPDVIVNCAAYTNVENAEEDYENAYKINAEGPKNLIEYCNDNDTFLIHISTDFVFDGNQKYSYSEDDDTNPINIYGETKLEGENEVINNSNGENYIIIRTSWLYSEEKKNFVKTMYERIKNKKYSKVVDDEVGSPTYAVDLAKFIFHIIEKGLYSNNFGLYNFSNVGRVSRYEFAKNIEMLYYGKDKGLISRCNSSDFPTKAERPKFSALNVEKICNTFNYTIPIWYMSLSQCIINLNKE